MRRAWEEASSVLWLSCLATLGRGQLSAVVAMPCHIAGLDSETCSVFCGFSLSPSQRIVLCACIVHGLDFDLRVVELTQMYIRLPTM